MRMEVWHWGTEQCSAMGGGGVSQLGFIGDLNTGAVGASRTCLAGLAWQTLACRYWGTTEGSVSEWPGHTRALVAGGNGMEPGRTPCRFPGPCGCLQCFEGPKTQGWGNSTVVTSACAAMEQPAKQWAARTAARCPGLNPAYTS